MSEVKLSQAVVDVDKENPSFPKANPYLLQEFRTRIQQLEAAESEAEYQRHLHSFPADQRKLLKEQREEQKKSAVDAAKPASTPEEISKDQIKTEKSLAGRVVDGIDFFVMGEDPEKIKDLGVKGVEKAKELAAAAKEKVDQYASRVGVENVAPFTFARVDPDQNRSLRDAETKLHVEKYRMRKLLEQVENYLNPFSGNGKQIGQFGPYEKNINYDTRSSQESLSILATILAVSSELAQKKNDPEISAKSKELAAFLEVSSKLSREEFESFGYTSENLSDEQLARKWGLLRGEGASIPGMGVLAKNQLPEMFFEVQQLITSYNVMQTLTGVEKKLGDLLKALDLSTELNESQKTAKRREIWKTYVADVLAGSVAEKDEFNGIKIEVDEHLYGAAIYAPLLMSQQGGLSLGEATTFRLLAEKQKRQAQGSMAQEQAYRIIDAYSYAESSGKIRDLVQSKFGKKAEELSDVELDQALEKNRKEFGNDYVKAENLYGLINKNLPAFIELRRALEPFVRGEPPKEIDTAVSNQADFDLLLKDIRAARVVTEKVITDRLKLTPELAIKMADEFVARNQGNLSPEANQIPQRVRGIAERTFGYSK